METSDQVQEISLALIDPNPNQPRKTFEPVALQELANSIVEHGLIQPITLARRGERYLIIAGERRWRAHMLAGLKTIRAFVQESDAERVAALALVENEQRAEVNVIETVEAWSRYMSEFGWSVERVADLVKRDLKKVREWLTLLDLANELKALVARGAISAGQGVMLARLPKHQQVFAARVMGEQRLNARELEGLCLKLLRCQVAGSLFDLDAFLMEVQRKRALSKRERVEREMMANVPADVLLMELERRGMSERGMERKRDGVSSKESEEIASVAVMYEVRELERVVHEMRMCVALAVV